MSETPYQDLSGVAETLLITLYLRALESQRRSCAAANWIATRKIS